MSSPDETIPTITLGGRTFSVPEFSIKAQRKVTPALVKAPVSPSRWTRPVSA